MQSASQLPSGATDIGKRLEQIREQHVVCSLASINKAGTGFEDNIRTFGTRLLTAGCHFAPPTKSIEPPSAYPSKLMTRVVTAPLQVNPLMPLSRIQLMNPSQINPYNATSADAPRQEEQSQTEETDISPEKTDIEEDTAEEVLLEEVIEPQIEGSEEFITHDREVHEEVEKEELEHDRKVDEEVEKEELEQDMSAESETAEEDGEKDKKKGKGKKGKGKGSKRDKKKTCFQDCHWRPTNLDEDPLL